MQVVRTDVRECPALVRHKWTVMGLSIAEAVFYLAMLIAAIIDASQRGTTDFLIIVFVASSLGLVGSGLGIAAPLLANKQGSMGLGIGHVVLCSISIISTFVMMIWSGIGYGFLDDRSNEHSLSDRGWVQNQGRKPYLLIILISSLINFILSIVSVSIMGGCDDRCCGGSSPDFIMVQGAPVQSAPVHVYHQQPQQVVYAQQQQPIYVQQQPQAVYVQQPSPQFYVQQPMHYTASPAVVIV